MSAFRLGARLRRRRGTSGHAYRRTSVGLIALMAIVGLSIAGGTVWGDAGKAVQPQWPKRTLVGVLEASPGYFATERRNGIGVVTLSVLWAKVEPRNGRFSDAYAARVNGEIADARRHGLEVSLDLGLQYAPGWVFSLPGGTRFVDQYHQSFGGSAASGNNVANGVTDPAVRAAQARYLRWVGGHIGRGLVLSVREGGGPFGELRYPDAAYRGHTDCWWAFDASSQKTVALRQRPGRGTAASARRFLTAYNADLDRYGLWLDGQVAADFTAKRLLLLPGWGQRPGTAGAVASSRLTRSPAEFNEGLDWTALVAGLRHPAGTVLYTTYLDAPTLRPTPQLESPLSYLASIDRAGRFRLGGENTGGGSQALMDSVLSAARAHHLTVVNWMSQAQLAADQRSSRPSGPTFSSYGRAATRLLHR